MSTPRRHGLSSHASRVTAEDQRAQLRQELVDELQHPFHAQQAQPSLDQFLLAIQQSLATSVAQMQEQVNQQAQVVSALLQRQEQLLSRPAPSTPRPVDLPYPQFSGASGEDVSLFLFTLESVLDSRLITDDTAKLRVIPSILKGGALAWARDGLTAGTIKTWSDFTQLLTASYTRPDLQIHLRDRLRTLHQETDIDSYTAQFRVIFNQVKDMSQLDAIHAYTRGLDKGVASRIQLSTIKTLDAAIAAALDNERSMAVLKMPGPVPMDTSINVASTSAPTADQAEAYVFNASRRPSTRGRPWSRGFASRRQPHPTDATPGVICHRCGQEGHLASGCFNARKK